MLTSDVQLENFALRERAMNHLTARDVPLEEIYEIIKKMYIADREDFTEEDIRQQILVWHETNLKDKKSPARSMQGDVEAWLASNTSNNQCYSDVSISLLSCYSDLGLKTPNEKASCRMVFKRLVEKGKLEPSKHKSGTYRYINAKMEELDFLNADTTPFNLRFPLGVHELVEIYKKSVIVLAGEPNAGKTAYMLNLARKNMDEHKVMYFSSEMGAAELQIRLKKFNHPLESWTKIRWIAKSGDFHRAIDPNGLNIIDYLEVAKDFYEIGGLLTDIFNALDKGVAVVGLQKPAGRDTGVGGARTLDKARLYMAIEPGILKIVKGKLWRQECVNPNGLWVKWSLVGGAKFTVLADPNTGDTWRKP